MQQAENRGAVLSDDAWTTFEGMYFVLPASDEPGGDGIRTAMIRPQPKIGRVKLIGPEYRAFKFEIHELDGWICKVCRKRKPLTIEHMVNRSKIRLDTKENCVSACEECHHLITIGAIIVKWSNIDSRDIQVIKCSEVGG